MADADLDKQLAALYYAGDPTDDGCEVEIPATAVPEVDAVHRRARRRVYDAGVAAGQAVST